MTFINIECPKYNTITSISFDVIDASTMNKQEYIISLMRKCTLCQNICQNCPFLALVGQPVDHI